MSTKQKALPPPKSAGEVLAMLKLTKNKGSSGYASQLGQLLNFLHITSDIRTGAEVVETELNIDSDGRLLQVDFMRNLHIGNLENNYRWNAKEVLELKRQRDEAHAPYWDLHTIIRRKNKEEKKEKARKELEEIDAVCKELDNKVGDLILAERKRLEELTFTIEEMREDLKLMTGVKIKVELETGNYTFPVPTFPDFYRVVCNLLGLPLPNQEVVEKPVIKRMFTMPPDVLVVLKKAAKFASTDDLRPAMTCLCLEINNGKMTVVATDAHRLFKSHEIQVDGPEGSFTYLLPVSALKRLPKTAKDPFMFYELKGDKVAFLDVTVSLLDARYPDYKVVIPKYDHFVEFNRKDFISNVMSAMTYSNRCTNQVNLDINGDIKMAGQDVDFSFESHVRMNYLKKEIPDTVIAFNGQFLKEGLGIFSETSVKMYTDGSPTRAAIFSNDIDTVLLMPLMSNQ